jgi:hypothetical protein
MIQARLTGIAAGRDWWVRGRALDVVGRYATVDGGVAGSSDDGESDLRDRREPSSVFPTHLRRLMA